MGKQGFVSDSLLNPNQSLQSLCSLLLRWLHFLLVCLCGRHLSPFYPFCFLIESNIYSSYILFHLDSVLFYGYSLLNQYFPLFLFLQLSLFHSFYFFIVSLPEFFIWLYHLFVIPSEVTLYLKVFALTLSISSPDPYLIPPVYVILKHLRVGQCNLSLQCCQCWTAFL